MFLIKKKVKKPYRLGLALSGGGARGFAHVGALRALEEYNLRPEIIAGVSAGSVVTALYASGRTCDEILRLFHQAKFSDFAEIGIPRGGLFSLDRFRNFIEKSTGVARIEDLKIPAVICATDLDHGCRVAFDHGPLADCVTASCSIPIVFKPVKIDGVSYVDGGVLNNLPAWAIRKQCQVLIGVNCSPINDGPIEHTLMEVAQRSYSLLAKSNAYQDLATCDIAVDVKEIADYKVFNLKETEKVYRSGYEATLAALRARNLID